MSMKAALPDAVPAVARSARARRRCLRQRWQGASQVDMGADPGRGRPWAHSGTEPCGSSPNALDPGVPQSGRIPPSRKHRGARRRPDAESAPACVLPSSHQEMCRAGVKAEVEDSFHQRIGDHPAAPEHRVLLVRERLGRFAHGSTTPANQKPDAGIGELGRSCVASIPAYDPGHEEATPFRGSRQFEKANCLFPGHSRNLARSSGTAAPQRSLNSTASPRRLGPSPGSTVKSRRNRRQVRRNPHSLANQNRLLVVEKRQVGAETLFELTRAGRSWVGTTGSPRGDATATPGTPGDGRGPSCSTSAPEVPRPRRRCPVGAFSSQTSGWTLASCCRAAGQGRRRN